MDFDQLFKTQLNKDNIVSPTRPSISDLFIPDLENTFLLEAAEKGTWIYSGDSNKLKSTITRTFVCHPISNHLC